MTRSPIGLQDLRRKIFAKAKAEPAWRFGGCTCMSASWRRSRKLTGWPRRTMVRLGWMVVLVHPHPNNDWLTRALPKRLREEFAKLQVEVNEEKSRTVDLRIKGESFTFLGFQFFRVKAKKGKWTALRRPKAKKRTELKRKLKKVFQSHRSQPVNRVIEIINPILAGWVGYFAIGNSSRAFSDIRYWVEKKVRRHLSQARGRKAFGWKRWSTRWLYEVLGLFGDYRLYRPWLPPKASPA